MVKTWFIGMLVGTGERMEPFFLSVEQGEGFPFTPTVGTYVPQDYLANHNFRECHPEADPDERNVKMLVAKVIEDKGLIAFLDKVSADTSYNGEHTLNELAKCVLDAFEQQPLVGAYD